MSTNATVKFRDRKYNREFTIYKHGDGYPSAMLPELKRFKKYNESRNDDINYTAANYVYGVKTQEDSPLTGVGIVGNDERQEFNYLYELVDGEIVISRIKEGE